MFVRLLLIALVIFAGAYLALGILLFIKQRSLLFFPSHYTNESPMSSWRAKGETIGYSREVTKPKAVWLMMHGNGGQASMRGYVLRWLPSEDAFYVLEYPGYGLRRGAPSKDAFNAAAEVAYRDLQTRFPDAPVNVIGESMGSGPACYLASLPHPPAKLILLVPFDRLSAVAAQQFPWFPVRWLMKDDWDNLTALRNYRGPVKILGAIDDRVIPIEHAKNLAAHVPQAKFEAILGGHGWSETPSLIDFD